MKTLIKIKNQNGQQVVSARELSKFLKVKGDFTTWCKRMFDYGFEENLDYSLIKIGERNAHNKIDYALTLDCAKEISMLQRNDKGKQARKYFIEVEKQAKKLKNVSGQSLLIVGGGKQINITREGFMNARNNPEKLKDIIQNKVKSLQ